MEGQDAKVLQVKANVVDQALHILSIENEERVGCIQFGDAYYGSDKTECALLYNSGPEAINFVAILDEDAIAQEMVSYFICYLLGICLINLRPRLVITNHS